VALYLPGKTTCGICERVIEAPGDLIMFPAFLGKNHPLHLYSDGAFHRWCFEASHDREAVERAFANYQRIWDTRPKDPKSKEAFEAWGRSALAEFD